LVPSPVGPQQLGFAFGSQHVAFFVASQHPPSFSFGAPPLDGVSAPMVVLASVEVGIGPPVAWGVGCTFVRATKEDVDAFEWTHEIERPGAPSTGTPASAAAAETGGLRFRASFLPMQRLVERGA
jgi:hypothetical protein